MSQFNELNESFDRLLRAKPTPHKCYIFIAPNPDEVNGLDTVIGYGMGPDPETAFNEWRENDGHRAHHATGTIEALQFLPGPHLITA